MRSGVRLGVDVGKARIGVARSDLHGMLATPVETVPRDTAGVADHARLIEIAREINATEVIVGLPLNMRGERTLSTDDAADFAHELAARLARHEIAVRLVDERLSTVSAQGQLRQAGKKTKQTRSIIDQAAAVVILQHALDSERAQGAAPGQAVEVVDADAKEKDA
ncbi:Holliday junction resolvase RuvX [Leucobacter luti]|uniref:Putative pre-16S rRNA nuclease n=1 Tax=Leucobacter luti TaxID=340320 RepID=A0A4R6RUY6_9MICO|nr:Holliday junction resolvase RuvX [Leucobacter luti]MCW2287929.1 putative Holliday junction resolvase [Leucobacter luti]QYM76073.1 Holliday junction resolvase RuvX [Leucobacter luti]TCK45909.1 putative Holliday junction resolvase [Leucobacter luti]TDP90197.1 putative Holliday junction resolvase [Leucobacter luti]